MSPDAQESGPTEAAVAAYLREHPDFLRRHPELLETFSPPEAGGGKVADFQAFAIRALQGRVRTAEQGTRDAVDVARGHVGLQAQIHEAALRLVRAGSLEQLLEALTIDMAQLLDCDVVRLGLESEVADLYESYHSEEHYSGIVFLGEGAGDVFFGDDEALFFADTEKQGGFLVDELFLGCTRLARSAALLRIALPSLERGAVLGLGARFAGRYAERQPSELFTFLARLIAEKLDRCLQDTGVEV